MASSDACSCWLRLLGGPPELLLALALESFVDSEIFGSLMLGTERRGDAVLDAVLDEDWEDFRRIATGLLLFAGVLA